MSLPSGTFASVNPSLFSDDNSNQTQKQRKRRLEVWNHFDKYEDENGKKWAICKICNVKKNGSSKIGTTHLYNHFNSCSKNKKNEGGGSASGDIPAENSNQTQEISQIGEQNVGKETVGLDFGKSSNKKQKKLRSPVWENFEKYKDENGKDLAKCNICEKVFNGSSKMGTTHLKNHFNSCSKNKKNEGRGSASGDKPAEDSVMDQQLNHLDKSNEGGGSASGDIPAENSVMDQQLNHLDKSNEGAGSASGDEPAEDSLMDQQLNHLDKSNKGGGSGSGDKPAEDSVMDQQLNHLDKSNEGGGSGSGDIPAEDSVMDQQLNHLDKSNEGGGSASGDIPAEDSVMDQQLNHWDKSNEGAGSGSGDKPVENSMMDQQLNRLDMVKMPIKQSSEFEPLPKSIEAVEIINAYNEEKEKLLIYLLKEKIDAARQCYIEMESANNVLRAQIMELTDHLRSLNSVLQIWGEVCGLNVEIPDVKPWKLPFPMQPILASADMFKF